MPRPDWSKTLPVVLVVSLIAAFAVGGYAAERANQKQEIADAIASYYESTRGAVKNLCDDKANATKPECLKTPPPVEKIAEQPKAAPTKYLPPNPADLAALVGSYLFTYCGSDGSCEGEQGRAGRDGKDVTLSQVFTAVGQMIDDALLRSCGGSCVSTVPGPTGPSGADGVNGDNGRGIAHTYCNPAGLFVVEYTDGERETIDGSRCRSGVAVDPLPSE